jgi:CAAX prenyl protease-like protein
MIVSPSMRAAIPYVLPFAVFMAFLGLQPYNPLPAVWDQVVRIAVVTAVLWLVSRPVLDFRCSQPVLAILVGIATFAVWILPDLLVPGYRSHWLFSNSLLGAPKSSLPAAELSSGLLLFLRGARAVILVPIIEELFWRGWVLRWLKSPEFEKVPLGTYAPGAFWISAALFASEHGPYWDVGLAAGLIYNGLVIRTKRLGDCILAHAVTNLALSLYTIATGKWEYWM